MECKDIQKRLSPYIEGLISADEKKGLEDHLKVCPSCRTALEDLKKVGDLVKGLKEIEPPPWLTRKIMARIREEEGRKVGIIQKLFYPLHIKVPIQAMATVFIAVTALYLFYSMEPEVHKIQAPTVAEQAVPRDEGKEQPRPPAAASAPSPEKVPPPVSPEVDKKVETPRGEEKLGAREAKKALPLPRESAPSPPAPSLPGEKKEMLAAKQEPAKGTLEAERPKAAPHLRYDRAPALKKEETYAAAPDLKERRALSEAPAVARQAYKKADAIGFTVRVQDVPKASLEVRNLLAQLGAQRINQVSLEDKVIFTAILKPETIEELRKKLQRTGDVQEKGTPSPAPEEDPQVRVEIMGPR